MAVIVGTTAIDTLDGTALVDEIPGSMATMC